MRINILLIPLIILILLDSFTTKEGNKEYIKLLYVGDQSKPYPPIVLYFPGSFDIKTVGIFPETSNLEISKDRFDEIKKLIVNRSPILNDSALLDSNSYEFLIFNNGEATILLTPYLTRIRQIFNIIISHLKNTEKEIIIKQELDDIIIRLIFDNKLK
jgi:hypothetical protein